MQLQSSKTLQPGYNLDVDGRRATWDKTYLGFVKDVNDSMHMGRIKVYIPELCGNQDSETTWIICDYATPFGGATNILDTNKNPTSGQVSYGMTFIPPDINNQVIVSFINGDPNRGIWMGCLFQVNANHMVPSTPDPDTFPVGPVDGKEPRKPDGKIPIYETSTEAEKHGGVNGLPISQGGAATLSMGNSITTMGIRTPRGHSLVLEDNPTDGYARIQTRHGAQLLLYDTTDRIIIKTGSNRARIELDREGNIDLYTHQNLSIRSDGDINLSAKNNINISAENEINLQSYGKSHFYSQDDFHIKTFTNMFLSSEGEMHRVANGSIFDTSTRKIQRYANFGILDTTTDGPIELHAHGNIHQYSYGTFDILADNTMSIQARGGSMRIKSATTLLMSSDAGGLYFKSAKDTRMQSGQDIDFLSEGTMFLTSRSKDISIKSVAGTLFVQSNADTNIKGGGNVIIQGNGNVDLKPGSGSVRTTKSIIINAGTIPDAKPAAPASNSYDAGPAAESEVAIPGIFAKSVVVTQHVITVIDSKASPGRTSRVVNSIVSRMPSADPSPTRTISGPGYTNIVKRKDAPPESTYKIGQVLPDQNVPLQVIGIVIGSNNGEIGRYTGTGWDTNNKPQYTYQKVPTILLRNASEWTGTSDNGIRIIQTHEGTGGLPPNKPGWVFPDACNSGQQLIGYGHVLTTTEISSKQISIAGTPVNWENGLSEEQMKLLLKADIKPIEDKIKSTIGGKQITQYQFDVLVDFVYNVGIDAFTQTGGVAELINTDKYNEVPNEMIRWILACGVEKPELKARRLENAMFWSGQVRADAPSQFSGSGSASSLATSDKARAIYCYLTKTLGYSPIVACGFIGNMCAESPLNPNDGINDSRAPL